LDHSNSNDIRGNTAGEQWVHRASAPTEVRSVVMSQPEELAQPLLAITANQQHLRSGKKEEGGEEFAYREQI